jgi:hypothetical protein
MASSHPASIGRTLGTIVPALILAFQVGAIVHARSVTSRYFCWAPYDTQTAYSARAIVNGHQLNRKEFQQRYRRPQVGTDNRSPQNVLDMFQQREEKAEKLGDHTTMDVTYAVNGKEPQEWHWPLDSTASSSASALK